VGKLQIGRFERLASRTYSIKGPGALVDLDETVLGVVLLERQGGMESHLIQGWETFCCRQSVGAVAAQFSWVLISNPVDSGTIVVLDNVLRDNSNMMEVMVTRGVPPGFVAGTVGVPLDTRMSVAQQPAGRVFRLNSAAGGFGSTIYQGATNELIEFPIVLGPDGSVAFRSGATNEALILATRWAERRAQPFEL